MASRPALPVQALVPLPSGDVTLEPSTFERRRHVNRAYLCGLRTENLLQNHYLEAGLWGPRQLPEGIHGGWESPTSPVRGHFLGHWLSAVAHHCAAEPDQELRGKADHVVRELRRCQDANGGEWVASIPEKYLRWSAAGRLVGQPAYVAGKTLMGLVDMATVGGSDEALDMVVRAARWYTRFTDSVPRNELDDFIDFEQGGMLEVFASLYAVTGEQSHLDLVERYDRRRLFDALLRGDDVLSERHANTTIAEALGAARAYEVTGEVRWRRVVEAYWEQAVTTRGFFVTGGQTSGEEWVPPLMLAERLGPSNQEFCTVYHMMRLAEYLLRWTGEASYASYRERNLYNGVLAQQHPGTGMVSYYLPLEAGAVKSWSDPTDSFWCCLGTMVQAIAQIGSGAVYRDRNGGLVIAQPLPADVRFETPEGAARVHIQTSDGFTSHPGLRHHGSPWLARDQRVVDVRVEAAAPTRFGLGLRIPDWLSGPAMLTIDGDEERHELQPGERIHTIDREWTDNSVSLSLPAPPAAVPLPGSDDVVAFAAGPFALAGLVEGDLVLDGVPPEASSLVRSAGEFGRAPRAPQYRGRDRVHHVRFKPLADIVDERYTVYFAVRPRSIDVEAAALAEGMGGADD